MMEADVLALLPKVARIARRMRTSRHPVMDQQDLEQEGILGLLRAVLAYDPAHGVPLATYAGWRIASSMRDAYRVFDPVGRHARRSGDTSVPVTLSLDHLTNRLDYTEVNSEISTLYKFIADDTEPLDVSAERCQLREAVEVACKALPLQLRLVLHFFYTQGLTMGDIGARLGVSASRVSQLHTEALALLRPQLVRWDDGTPKPRTQVNNGFRVPRKSKEHP